MSSEKRSWVVVTGASRGLGAALCAGLAKQLAPNSLIVGMARSEQGLQDTASKVSSANAHVKFVPIVIDLGKATSEDFSKALKGPLTQDSSRDAPARALMIHNAGSLGKLSYLRDHKDMDALNDYYRLNVSSVLCLNAIFLECMKELHPQTSLQVVNISSLCGVVPFKSWGLYCGGKAARDMLFKVLAVEEPDVLVLNYAPGPLDGEMQNIARSETADEEVRTAFASMKEEGKLLPCDESVRKFLLFLEQKKFKSGDHVDYYDEL